MGYMLPIIPFKYNHYQNRIITNHTEPYFIEGPYKVIFEKEQGQEKERHVKVEYSENVLKANVNKIKVNHVYARISGKGRKINKRV